VVVTPPPSGTITVVATDGAGGSTGLDLSV
jgi:hypothetical protein